MNTISVNTDSEKIGINYIKQFSYFPASESGRANEVLHSLHQNVKHQVNYLVNGRDFTNNIFMADSTLPDGTMEKIIDGKKYLLLPAGYDGVLMDYSEKNASIVIPTADCASVSFYNEKLGKMGILHA